jgi:hypothetical protein
MLNILMQEKDAKLLQSSALVVADQIVSHIPALNIAWGLSKALYESGMKLRQQKALEWVEMVRDNPHTFTKELLENIEFQDGFVCALEKYLTERNESKRKTFRTIFLGYADSDHREAFPLEKYIHTLSQLTEEDILTLRDVDVARDDTNYQVYGNNDQKITNIYNLINLGILHTDPSSRMGPILAPFVWLSDFGKEFRKYIVDRRAV